MSLMSIVMFFLSSLGCHFSEPECICETDQQGDMWCWVSRGTIDHKIHYKVSYNHFALLTNLYLNWSKTSVIKETEGSRLLSGS